MLDLTDAAINQAISKTQDDGNDTIRIGVTGGGCTGFKYIFDFADTVHSSDHILDYGKFKIVIDEDSPGLFSLAKAEILSLLILSKAEIRDFVSGFSFNLSIICGNKFEPSSEMDISESDKLNWG